MLPRNIRHGTAPLTLLIGLAWLFSPPPHETRAADARPNIVLMMADDMGYSDIGCYGGEIETPNLDRLAAGGLRFTQFYNTARCCPTRASLMTGLYQHQAGVGHMTADKGFDAYRGDLNTQCVTIAEVLRPAGYGTYISGKWHVTKHTKPEGPKFNWPLQRGYTRYFGTIAGAGSFWTPGTLTTDNTQIQPPSEGFYYTDAISDHAATFITDHHQSRPDDPLFIYVAFTSPHWPLHAPRKDIQRYLGKYAKGWDALRAERHARMIDLGLLDRPSTLSPRDEKATAWDQVDTEKKKEMDLRMAVYAAQIDVMDQGIGRVVAALEKTGRLENTLIFFLADNGGCAEGGPWGFERNKGGLIGDDSSFASYGLSWANASNTPFRLYKHWVHEGGISTPLIVHWPNGFDARGELRGQPGHLIDIMATCVDVSGATYPKTFNNNPIVPMEGRSLTPAFANQPIQREAIYWEHEGNRAVRRGDWKLVSKHPGDWELYDIESDRTELNNLAQEHPDRVAELTTLWEAWAARCGIQPWPVGGGKPKKNVGSKQTEFELGPGDNLARKDSPAVAGRSIVITAALGPEPSDGVIVAQGGSSLGYALYVDDGKLCLALRNGGGLTVVTAADKLPPGAIVVMANLQRDGRITLEVAGNRVADGKAPGSIQSMPIDGLQVGSDLGGTVGHYQAPNKYGGTINSVSIQLGK